LLSDPEVLSTHDVFMPDFIKEVLSGKLCEGISVLYGAKSSITAVF
jgi:hypothetical protein